MKDVLLDTRGLVFKSISRLFLTFFIFISLHGCAVLKPSSSQTHHIKLEKASIKPTNIPSLNIIVDAELGDTLIAQGTLKTLDAIRLLTPIRHKKPKKPSDAVESNIVSIIPVGVLAKTATITNSKFNGSLYLSEEFVVKKNDKPINNYSGGIVLDSDNENTPAICAWTYLEDLECAKLSSDVQYENTKKSTWIAENFLQELIYNGRAGNQVKFIYREFKNGMARDAFTQDVTYDLKIGDVIGFKSARFRILKADNISIKYEVMSNF